MGKYIQREKDEIFFFNKQTGLWRSGDEAIKSAVLEHKEKLIWFYLNGLGKKCQINYSGSIKNVTAMIQFMKPYILDTNFITKNIDTSLGKLLFQNGIYDIATDTFTEGFDSNIVFLKRIKRDFSFERNEKLIAEVNKSLFEDPYNSESGLFFKKTVLMAIFGDYRRKQFNTILGDSNSGKGVTTAACIGAFDEYVSTWDSSELLAKDKSGMDAARQNTWLLNIYGTRISISNEMKPNSIIEVNVFKKATGGGDELVGRQSYGLEIKFRNTATLFLFANDFGSFSAKDESGVAERAKFIRMENVFKTNPEPGTNQRLARPELKNLFETNVEYQKAFFWVIMDTYKLLTAGEKKLGGKFIEPDCVKAEISEWINPAGDDVKAILEEQYEITKNENDCIQFNDIRKLFIKAKSNMSDTKLGRILTSMGLLLVIKKVNGKVIRVRTGVKLLEG
jgi:phage/plasmid-associated DNA primase